MYKKKKKLLDKFGVTAYKVAKETGVTTATLTNWKNGKYTPKPDKLQKIADYFGVPLSYLLTGNMEEKAPEPQITPKDERDIQKKLNKIMDEIRNKEDSPLYYNGEEIDDTSLELLEAALESAMRQMKIINKEKFNPNKNKDKSR